MNGSDACNTKEFFYITPGWSDFRVIKPFQAGASYRSYVRMFPIEDKPNIFAGDIYALQGGVVVGMLGQIRFKRVPRMLMDRLFVAPDAQKSSTNERQTLRSGASTGPSTVPVSKKPSAPKAPMAVPKLYKETAAPPVLRSDENTKRGLEAAESATSVESVSSEPSLVDENPVITDCLRLIARETGLELEVFTDEASFIELGIDSLMSLVLSEKFRSELRIEVQSSVFLECPSVAELKEFLEQYC